MRHEGTLHELKPLAVIRLMNGDTVATEATNVTFQEHGVRVWEDVTHQHSTFYPFFAIQSVQT